MPQVLSTLWRPEEFPQWQKLSMEIKVRVFEWAIPPCAVDSHPCVPGNDQERRLKYILSLSLSCKLAKDVVDKCRRPFLRFERLTPTGQTGLGGEPIYKKEVKIIRFDLANDRLRINNGQTARLTFIKPGLDAVCNVVAQYDSMEKVRQPGAASSFNPDSRCEDVPGLRDAIVAVREPGDAIMTVEWPQSMDASAAQSGNFLKAETDDPSLQSLYEIRYNHLVYVPPWNWSSRYLYNGVHPILRGYNLTLLDLYKYHAFLSLRGYTKEGGAWAGFYYSTATNELYFTALECRDVIDAFGICNTKFGVTFGARDRAPDFVARVWVDPSHDVIAKYNWVPVREPGVEDGPLATRAAALWAQVRPMVAGIRIRT